MRRVMAYLKREPVLALSAAAALLSCLFTPPSAAYLGYVDGKVLALLFCLMAVVAGVTRTGFMQELALRLLARVRGAKRLALLLTLFTFFSSMLITNDVALITFVPFTLLLLGGLPPLPLAYLLSVQTIAANLGSALTPVGNPQNLYLYSHYSMRLGTFFSLTLPLCGAGLAVTVGMALLTPYRGGVSMQRAACAPLDKKRLLLHALLFVLSLAGVFSLLPWPWVLGAVVVALALFDKPVFAQVDYALLLTFVCFFVFVGNLSAIPAVREALSRLMQTPFVAALGLSQVISNVPAAVLLSGFTKDASALVLGVNVGGLGTLVASLASLISFKLYLKQAAPRPRLYLWVFTALNLIALLPLALLAFFL